MKLCILEVNRDGPSKYHNKLFTNNLCDYYYVSFKKKVNDKRCLKYCPGTSWAQTRNILYELVPKIYDYYCFIDDDIILESRTSLNPIEQLIEDLKICNPAVLAPVYNIELKSFSIKKGYCNRLFSNNCIKIVHKSMLDWLFPYCTKYDGGNSAAHFFNFLEIPFKDHIVTTLNVMVKNPVSCGHNKNQRKNMEKMWQYVKPSFKNIYAGGKNSMDIKKYYVDKFTNYNIQNGNDIENYLNDINLREYFDFSHEFFKNKNI